MKKERKTRSSHQIRQNDLPEAVFKVQLNLYHAVLTLRGENQLFGPKLQTPSTWRPFFLSAQGPSYKLLYESIFSHIVYLFNALPILCHEHAAHREFWYSRNLQSSPSVSVPTATISLPLPSSKMPMLAMRRGRRWMDLVNFRTCRPSLDRSRHTLTAKSTSLVSPDRSDISSFS